MWSVIFCSSRTNHRFWALLGVALLGLALDAWAEKVALSGTLNLKPVPRAERFRGNPPEVCIKLVTDGRDLKCTTAASDYPFGFTIPSVDKGALVGKEVEITVDVVDGYHAIPGLRIKITEENIGRLRIDYCLIPNCGGLKGTVKDPASNVIVNADLTAESLDTGVRAEVHTGTNGQYDLSPLPAGPYNVTIEARGFLKQETRIEIARVESGEDFTLKVGRVTETVSVSETLVNSEQTSFGEVITDRTIKELPLNGRNYTELARLAPGVTSDRSSFSAAGQQSNLLRIA